MEYDAPRAAGIQPELLKKMPGNSLTLAVFIGCEPYHIGLLGGLAKCAHQIFLIGRHFIVGSKVCSFIRLDLFFREIPDMAIAGKHLIVLPKKLFDGLGLGRRLNYYEILHYRL